MLIGFDEPFFMKKPNRKYVFLFLSEEAQLCLSRKQICVSAKNKFVPFAEEKNTRFFPFFREALLCLSKKQINASTGTKYVLLVEGKKMHFFLFREARL
jgi:hypothetical protein